MLHKDCFAYSEIRKEKQGEAVKGCPRCHRLMKTMSVKGKRTWFCQHCGARVSE